MHAKHKCLVFFKSGKISHRGMRDNSAAAVHPICEKLSPVTFRRRLHLSQSLPNAVTEERHTAIDWLLIFTWSAVSGVKYAG